MSCLPAKVQPAVSASSDCNAFGSNRIPKFCVTSKIRRQKVTFSEDAAREIAREALQRKVGARGLRMILEELMLDLMYYVPGNKKIAELTITAEMVKKHSLTLPMLLEKAG
jgi:ATP-dependent protease Clp ATPase subunit